MIKFPGKNLFSILHMIHQKQFRGSHILSAQQHFTPKNRKEGIANERIEAGATWRRVLFQYSDKGVETQACSSVLGINMPIKARAYLAAVTGPDYLVYPST